MNKKLTIFWCGLLMAGFTALSQQKSDSLIMRDLLLEKDYSPQIENAGKVYHSPGTEEIQTNKQAVNFATEGHLITLDKDLVPMQMAESKIDFPEQDKPAYLRLGGGTRLNLLADAQVNFIRQERQRLEAQAYVRSLPFDKTTKDIAVNSVYRGDLRYQYHFNTCALSASLSEDYRNWSNLSNTQTSWSSDSRMTVGFASKNWGNDFQYAVHADAHLFHFGKMDIKGSALERELTVNTDLSYRIDDNWKASLDIDIKNVGYEHADLNALFWYDIQPSLSYRWRLWDLALGLHLSDIVGKESPFRVAATASASRSLGENAAFRLSLDGGEKVYSYREGFDINPYLNPKERLQASYSPLHLDAQLVWNPWNMLQLEAQVGYQHLRNMAHFSRVDTIRHISTVNYNSVYTNANVLYAKGGFDFRYGKFLRMSGDVSYRHYDKKLWYAPGLIAHASLEMKPTEALSLTADYHWAGLRYGDYPGYDYVRMTDYYYYALSLSYQWRKWGVFTQCRSLLDPQYKFWNPYTKFNDLVVLIGASYSF